MWRQWTTWKEFLISRDVRKKTKIKLRLTILSFYLYRVKDIFKRISAGLSSAQLGFTQFVISALFLGNILRARKDRFALCFRVLSNRYVERTVYANVFKFNRENKRFERAKVNFRCFHWFSAAMLQSFRRAPTWRLHTKPYNFP